jgi:hypothetical protein
MPDSSQVPMEYWSASARARPVRPAAPRRVGRSRALPACFRRPDLVGRYWPPRRGPGGAGAVSTVATWSSRSSRISARGSGRRAGCGQCGRRWRHGPKWGLNAISDPIAAPSGTPALLGGQLRDSPRSGRQGLVIDPAHPARPHLPPGDDVRMSTSTGLVSVADAFIGPRGGDCLS